MSDIRLTTTPVAGLRRLATHGQPVAAMHRQLAAILGNRLGQQHAQLLARPEAAATGDAIDWYSPPLGAVRRLTEIADAERRAIETLQRQLTAEIGQLAARMRMEGDSAALVAHMLDLALITPPDAAVYAVGTQPVLVLWGFATGTQPVPEPPVPSIPSSMLPPPMPPPPMPPRAEQPPPAAVPASASASAAAKPTAEPATGAAEPAAKATVAAALAAAPAKRGWAAWLLPLLLLLLLAVLVWQASRPLAPIVVEHPAPPAPPAADPAIPEIDKETALRGELARLTQERDRQLALCRPITPVPPPAPAVVPAPPLPSPPQKAEVPLPQPKAKPPVPEKAKPQPQPQPKPTAPPTEAKPAPPPKVEKKPATPTEPPETVAVAPPVPRVPPKSRCALNVRPGDEPEVILVVDASGSMEDAIPGSSSRMAAAKGAIEQVIGGLPPEVEIGLVDFTDCNQIRVDDFYPNARRPALIGQVRGLQPERRTALARSLERAGSRASSSADSTIVVVTDGEDSCGGDPCAAAASIRRRKPNVTINVIDVSGSGSPTAQCIARNGGGKVLTPSSALDMKTKVQQATGLPDTRTCK